MGKQRTITLTGTPPVRINEDLWPEIAAVHWYSKPHDKNHSDHAALTVREHEDGRRIVYGVHYPHSGNGITRAGYILAERTSDTGYADTLSMRTVSTIRAVAKEIGEPMPPPSLERLVRDCVSALPTRELA